MEFATDYNSSVHTPEIGLPLLHTALFTVYCLLSTTAATMAPPQVKIRMAAVHAAPVFMDKKATTDKVVRLIEQAGQEKIELLVFPETFIPGYPVS